MDLLIKTKFQTYFLFNTYIYIYKLHFSCLLDRDINNLELVVDAGNEEPLLDHLGVGRGVLLEPH